MMRMILPLPSISVRVMSLLRTGLNLLKQRLTLTTLIEIMASVIFPLTRAMRPCGKPNHSHYIYHAIILLIIIIIFVIIIIKLTINIWTYMDKIDHDDIRRRMYSANTYHISNHQIDHKYIDKIHHEDIRQRMYSANAF